MRKIVITSGYFNPLHIGHVNLMRDARALGDFLVVIVNSDDQVKLKGSFPFMPQQERMEIIEALGCVDEVFLSIDCFKDGREVPIPASLESVAKKYFGCKLVFAKGGDRDLDKIPQQEKEVCRKFGIEVVANVGGGKVQSSSWLIDNAINNKIL